MMKRINRSIKKMAFKQAEMTKNKKNLFLTFILLSLLPLASFSQIVLTIEINGLRNSNGQILLEFDNEKGEKVKGISQSIADNRCIIVINNLEKGKYAFKYFHDENKNEKLDANWMKIPKEGYGFSNSTKGTFVPPSIKKMIFEVLKDTTLKCSPAYLKL